MSAHIYDIMAGKVPRNRIGGSREVPPWRQVAVPSTDPYFGFEVLAKTCARFLAHHFKIFAPPEGVMPLDKFIAWVIYRTRYRSSTTFAALYLTGLLKERFQDLIVSHSRLTCHRLFLASFMVASKSIHDDTYTNKSFAELADKKIATVSDINTMEREILRYIDWKVNISNEVIEEFRRMVEHDFRGAGPYPTYRYTPPGTEGAPLQIPTAILSESPVVSGALTTRPAPPSAFLPLQSTVSYPPRPASPPRPKRIPATKEYVPTMQQVHRAPVSVVVPPAGPHRATTYPPLPQYMPVANPYKIQPEPSRMATLPFSSHVHPVGACPSGMMVPTADKGWVVIPSGGPTILW